MKKLLSAAVSILTALFLIVIASHSQTVTAFDPTPIGQTVTKSLSLTVPAGALTITSAAIEDGFSDFALESTTCIGAAAGAQCTAVITFQPTLPGERSGPLVLTDGGGNKFYFGFNGVGQAPQTAFTPGTIATVAGTYNGGSGGYSGDGGAATSATLNFPTDVALDGAGNLFVADAGNNALREVDAKTGTISSVENAATPVGVAVDSAGQIYFTGGTVNLVEVISADRSSRSTVAGTGVAGYSGDGGPASAAQLDQPTAIVVDAAGDIYFADTLNNVIRRIDAATKVITTVAGNNTFGFSGDAGLATVAEMEHPDGLAIDASGDLYIADSGNNRIRRVDAVTGKISTVVGGGSGCANMTDNVGDGCPATWAVLNINFTGVNVVGIALDAAGNLYIDDGVGVIRRVDAATQIISIVAGDGNATFSGDGGSATQAGLGVGGEGMAVDGAGKLYFADVNNQVIRAVDVAQPMVADFGTAAAGTTTSSKSVALSNIGNQPLNMTAISAGTNFVVQQASGATNCAVGTPVAVGAGCTLAAAFAPMAAGAITGSVTVTDNAPSATQTVALSGTGSQGNQTITFPAAALVYGTPVALSATASSGLPVAYTVTGPATVSGSTLTPTAIGSVTITANQAGNSAFTAASAVAQTVVVGPAPLAVTGNDATSLYGATPPQVSAAFSGFVNGDTAAAVSGIPTVTTTATAASPAGTYPVTPAMGTLKATNYVFTFANGTLTVGKAPLTVSAADATMAYGANLPTLTAKYAGFVNGDTASVVTGNAAVTTTATSASPVGSYPITAAVGTLNAANYAFVMSPTPGTLTVTPASQTITFAAIPDQVLGAAPLTLGATASSGLPVTFALVSGPATLQGSTLTLAGVGTVTVEADQAGDSNHQAAPAVQHSFAVAAAPALAVSLTPAALTFASQIYNTASAAQTVTLTNTGQAAVTIASIAASGDFADTTTCGNSLATGSNCTIAVVLTPTAAGSRAGTLTVTDSAGGSPQTVALTGTGSDLAIGAAAGGSTAATVTSGKSTSFNLSLTPMQGLTGTFTLSCTGAPKGATCTPNPASVNVTGTSPVAVSVNVTTTANSAVPWLPSAPSLPLAPLRLLWLALLAFGFMLMLMVRLGQKRGRVRRSLAGAAAFGMIALMTACGGAASGNGNTTPPPPPTVNSNATPPGAYMMTLKATDSSGATVGATNLNLTVQ